MVAHRPTTWVTEQVTLASSVELMLWGSASRKLFQRNSAGRFGHQYQSLVWSHRSVQRPLQGCKIETHLSYATAITRERPSIVAAELETTPAPNGLPFAASRRTDSCQKHVGAGDARLRDVHPHFDFTLFLIPFPSAVSRLAGEGLEVRVRGCLRLRPKLLSWCLYLP